MKIKGLKTFLAAVLPISWAPISLLPLGIVVFSSMYAALHIRNISLIRPVVYFGVFTLAYVGCNVGASAFLGKDIDYFQVARTIGPLLLGMVFFSVLITKRQDSSRVIANLHLLAMYAAIMLIIYFITGCLLLPNGLPIAGLDIVDEAVPGRLWIYPTFGILLLYSVSLIERKAFAGIFFLIILLTQSKAMIVALIVVTVICLRGGYKNESSSRWKLALSTVVVSLIASPFLTSIFGRFTEFAQVGDGWRLGEYVSAIEALGSSLGRWAFGNGIGISYREVDWMVATQSNERLIANMSYDIHSLYLDVIVKLGVVYLVAFFFFLRRLTVGLDNRIGRSIFAFVVITGFSSPSFFHSIDTVGFFVTLALIYPHYARQGGVHGH
jgi:hypothetical protein